MAYKSLINNANLTRYMALQNLPQFPSMAVFARVSPPIARLGAASAQLHGFAKTLESEGRSSAPNLQEILGMRVCVEQRRRRSGVVDVERNSPNPADVPYRPDDGSKSAVFGKGIGEYRADVKWIHYDSRPHLAAADYATWGGGGRGREGEVGEGGKGGGEWTAPGLSEAPTLEKVERWTKQDSDTSFRLRSVRGGAAGG